LIMQPGSNNQSRTALRAKIRKRRRCLSAWQQHQTTNSITRLIRQLPIYKRSRHIAFYLANDGEVSLRPLLVDALRQNKACYLPAINDQQMSFLAYRPEQELARNRFGILQPESTKIDNHSNHLDLVLVPLVAFDQSGNRLGMGGGFYDRHFAYKRQQPNAGPLLLGIAHDFQEVGQLSPQAWDVHLDGIVTNSRLII